MTDRLDWLSFRRFAAFTTALTLSLITLGVYTAATGSGLACQAQWPLCSDQLIPALTINPDFIEWFHRVVAMITGFFILGTAGWAWTRGNRQTKFSATLAVVLLPLQITVGAITVTIGGLVPGGYSPPTHAAHLIVALSIFTLLTMTTLFAYRDHHRRPPRSRSRLAVGVALGALLVSGLFSRGVPLLSYSPGAQAWFYAISLLAVAALLATVVWLQSVDRRGAWLAGSALAVLFVSMLLGRDLILYTTTVQSINFGLYLLTVGLVVATQLRLRSEAPRVAIRQSTQSE
ncbi:cytochrome c oxidase assembly protein subunit 15 [Halohasta litchfieldiae]|jgi:cytochrome c oxidase assembly protein subunit 15|uniref:Cytochrome c oxidase assembly protein subunit 15 n=1 Tax=Halohasta litchfieldiae TaxID=1073996 RepID=A0A1H6U8M8_9EURY|nr:COX15/CtaA family protein [Halohasta litchfieldiae]ATW87165.1 cytochrome c oxidase assembly protein subunit 15 [Halohasta litchfieldiae]SEI84232.1 cytochrome c oxidase assembly protein subunit 15 [Halohasta litchfieldiae]